MGMFYAKSANNAASAKRCAEAGSCCAFSGFNAGFCAGKGVIIQGTIAMVSFFVAVVLGILLHISILVLFIICLGGLLKILPERITDRRTKEHPHPI